MHLERGPLSSDKVYVIFAVCILVLVGPSLEKIIYSRVVIEFVHPVIPNTSSNHVPFQYRRTVYPILSKTEKMLTNFLRWFQSPLFPDDDIKRAVPYS